MGFFNYGKPKNRSHRKGVCVRCGSLSSDITTVAAQLMEPGQWIDYVLVKEIHPENQVLLEFWCRGYSSKVQFNGKTYFKNNVFHIFAEEDPEWVCDSDIGRGYVE